MKLLFLFNVCITCVKKVRMSLIPSFFSSFFHNLKVFFKGLNVRVLFSLIKLKVVKKLKRAYCYKL